MEVEAHPAGHCSFCHPRIINYTKCAAVQRVNSRIIHSISEPKVNIFRCHNFIFRSTPKPNYLFVAFSFRFLRCVFGRAYIIRGMNTLRLSFYCSCLQWVTLGEKERLLGSGRQLDDVSALHFGSCVKRPVKEERTGLTISESNVCKEFGTSFSLNVRSPRWAQNIYFNSNKLKTVWIRSSENTQRENEQPWHKHILFFFIQLDCLTSQNTFNHKDNNIWCLFIRFHPRATNFYFALPTTTATVAAAAAATVKLVKLSESIDIKHWTKSKHRRIAFDLNRWAALTFCFHSIFSSNKW